MNVYLNSFLFNLKLLLKSMWVTLKCKQQQMKTNKRKERKNHTHSKINFHKPEKIKMFSGHVVTDLLSSGSLFLSENHFKRGNIRTVEMNLFQCERGKQLIQSYLSQTRACSHTDTRQFNATRQTQPSSVIL